jgi:hypothetical protein
MASLCGVNRASDVLVDTCRVIAAGPAMFNRSQHLPPVTTAPYPNQNGHAPRWRDQNTPS